MLAEQAEMKADNYHYFICFGFPSGGCLWGVCIHAPLHVWVFKGPCEPGDTASGFHVGHQGVHSRNSCPVRESRRSPWGPGLGAPALGLHPAYERGQAQREVSYSVNFGFCFLLLFSQWCPGQGQPHSRQAMCKHSPAVSSEVNWHQTPQFLTLYYYGLKTPSVLIDSCDQSGTQQPSLKLLAKETVSVLHLGNVYMWIPGNTGTVVLALAPGPLTETTQAMQEGLKVAM